MGIVLTLKQATVEGFYASFWAWRPVVALLQKESVIDLESIGPIPDSFLFAEVDAKQALQIADFLDRFLQGLTSDQRMLLDGTITSTPDTGEFYRDQAEWHKNYSTDPEWLAQFRDFCRISGGFTIY